MSDRPRLFGDRILDVLGLVQDDAAPAEFGQVVDVAPGQAVGADHQVALQAALHETVPLGAAGAMVNHHAQVRGKALHLAPPVAY